MGAAEVATALGGKRAGRGYLARCVAHPDRNPSLLINDGEDGRLLLHCYAGCEFRDIIAALRSGGFLDGGATRTEAVVDIDYEAERLARSAAAASMWHHAKPALGTPVERYIRWRGIEGDIPPTLRFAEATHHPYENRALPAMIACITRWPDRRVIAVHRTFLQNDGRGKAGTDADKLMFGPCAGGAVRLGAVGDELTVAEGIESALSAQIVLGKPAWACLSTSGLKGVILPPLPLARFIWIAADNDTPGMAAANEAADKWTGDGRTVRICPPPQRGMDWNDALRSEIAHAQ